MENNIIEFDGNEIDLNNIAYIGAICKVDCNYYNAYYFKIFWKYGSNRLKIERGPVYNVFIRYKR